MEDATTALLEPTPTGWEDQLQLAQRAAHCLAVQRNATLIAVLGLALFVGLVLGTAI